MIQFLVDELRSFSPLCQEKASAWLAIVLTSQQERELAAKAEQRRLRREAARTAALRNIQMQIDKFSSAHEESLQQVADNEDSHSSDQYSCISSQTTVFRIELIFFSVSIAGIPRRYGVADMDGENANGGFAQSC